MKKSMRIERLHAYLWVAAYVIFGIITNLLEKESDIQGATELRLQSPLHWVVLCGLLFVFYPWLWFVRHLSKKASWESATIISTAFLFPFTGWLLMNIILTANCLLN